VAFQDLNPFPMKIISQKREYHRKIVKVIRKNKADICNCNWTWVVAMEMSPCRRLRCVWQLGGGLVCSSWRVGNITEVPGEGHDEWCHCRKAWQHV